MITMNSEEMIAINSLIDNMPIYGIVLEDAEAIEEERIKAVMVTLEEKEIIKDGALTDKGMIVTKLLDDYKSSKIHVFINRIRIALVDEQHAIVIEKKADGEYGLSRVLKVTLEKKLILSAPFLQKQRKERVIPYTIEQKALEDLERELDDPRWSEVLMIQKHKEYQMVENILYYMDADNGYCYDYIMQEKQQKSPKNIRQDLMDLLKIGEKEYGG